jgi:tetratricopeptide (TPR) repeat protein
VNVVLAALALLVQATSPADPAIVVRRGQHAVETDSAGAVATTWRSALARDSNDVSALLGLATVARLTYDYRQADRYYSAVARNSNARSRFAAWAALGAAESRLYRLPLDSAAAAFTVAATTAMAAGDSSAAAQAQFGLAIAKLRGPAPATAVAAIDRGFALLPPRETAIAAQGHCARAAVGGLLDARSAYNEATLGASLARQAGDRRREAFCLAMLGAYYLAIDDGARASPVFDSAVGLTRSAHDRMGGAIALWWRGHHRLEQYDHDRAQRDLSAALADADSSGNAFIRGWSWLRLSVVSWHFADMPSARRQLERGRDLLRAQGDVWGIGYARSLDGAMALDAGQIDSAEAAFRDDLVASERIHVALEQFTALFGLARVAMARGDWSAARARFDSATRVAQTHSLPGYLPQLEYEYGIVALRSGDLEEAERRFRRSLATRSGVTDLDRYAARSRIAEIHATRGDLARAERELTDATDAIDSLRAALGDRDMRVLAFQARKGYDDVDLGFATSIAALARGGRVDAALALAERRRARELRDRLLRGAPNLTRSLAGPGARWRLPDDQTAVLEYVTGAGAQPTTLFLVTPAGTRAVTLPPADSLATDIVAFAELVEAGAGAGALARQLGADVFGGVLDTLGARITRLIVVADGPLNRLPFDALRLADGRFVVQRFAVSMTPSLAVAADLRAKSRPPVSEARILALGDPRFANEVSLGGGSAAEIYREAFSTNGGLPRLRGSATEAKLVAGFARRSELRLRERASESYLKRAPLDSFDVVHLATHALVDERSIARTALAVADGDGDDGFIGPGELAALRLDARLVVLSACRTARGVSVRGEGVQGLTAPLLAAGARAVLATQWRIRDTDAVQFVDDFYGALARGNTVGDAARAAKLAAIARGAPTATWAAFSVVGDPFVTVALRVPQDRRPWVVAVAIGLAGTLLYGVRRTRRAGERSSVPSVSRAEIVQ